MKATMSTSKAASPSTKPVAVGSALAALPSPGNGKSKPAAASAGGGHKSVHGLKPASKAKPTDAAPSPPRAQGTSGAVGAAGKSATVKGASAPDAAAIAKRGSGSLRAQVGSTPVATVVVPTSVGTGATVVGLASGSASAHPRANKQLSETPTEQGEDEGGVLTQSAEGDADGDPRQGARHPTQPGC